jgi:hypothetical protein
VKVTTAVRSSGVSTDAIFSKTSSEVDAFSGFVAHSQVKRTSDEVNGVPSLQRTSGRSVSVTLDRSSASCPFSNDGTSVTRFGSRPASSP